MVGNPSLIRSTSGPPVAREESRRWSAADLPQEDFGTTLQNCASTPSETPYWRNNFRVRRTAARYEATRPPPWHRPTVQRQRVRLWVELPSEEDIRLWLKEELLELLRRQGISREFSHRSEKYDYDCARTS